jgi:hypothetical protein
VVLSRVKVKDMSCKFRHLFKEDSIGPRAFELMLEAKEFWLSCVGTDGANLERNVL